MVTGLVNAGGITTTLDVSHLLFQRQLGSERNRMKPELGGRQDKKE